MYLGTNSKTFINGLVVKYFDTIPHFVRTFVV